MLQINMLQSDWQIKVRFLGSFGGYVIVGFDHSIPNKGGYDFAIQGNAF